jgi:formylglycine-generating enzyme required for sulfatase activity
MGVPLADRGRVGIRLPGGARSQEECSFDFYLDRPTNDLSSTRANFNGNYPAGSAAKGPFLGRTTKVGSYPPNRLGFYDLHGNVREYTDSVVGSDHGLKGWGRVGRGGDFDDLGTACRAAVRDEDARLRTRGIGLRLARVRVPVR